MHEELGVFELENISPQLVSTVFAKAEFIENRHWKQIVTFVMKPLIMNCPASRLNTICGPILPSFCMFIKSKLDQEWGLISSSGYTLNDEE